MGIIINPDAPSPIFLAARSAAELEGALTELARLEANVASAENSLDQAKKAAQKQREAVEGKVATFKALAKEAL